MKMSANFCGCSCFEKTVGGGVLLILPRRLFVTLNNCLDVVLVRILEEKFRDCAR